MTGPTTRPTTRATTGRAAGLVVTLLALVLTALGPLQPGLSPAGAEERVGPPVAPRRVEGALTRKVVVDWHGTDGRKARSAPVPGIGTLTLVCRPRNTMVRLTPYDRSAETQLWVAKHEDKAGPAVAVKNVRVYRWAGADDDGRGGTGRSAHEGLNQATPVENYAQGFMHGVISQRPGRHRPAATAPRLPSTSLELSWYWNGFDHPRAYRSCRIAVTLETVVDRSVGVDWHGDVDGTSAPTTQVLPLAGLGEVVLTCSPDLGDGGRQEIMLRTDDPDSSLYVERIEGEGAVEDHVETDHLDHDPVLGGVPPVALPENGMLRLWWTAHGRTRRFVLSSYYVVNDAEHPGLNLCEVAAADF
ncbi:hypothetical protein I601_0718 [Nocardioides dokdonensis FR1436]|uniref:Uncharacterized protein n=1 Tax=Nocardioides dokdonensis FR1436 TaxID=1300347 RepID=A0A1A9GFX3_9ACTN|nr:hypothetical protein [Nocardioides dokdonensis]ANH37168.1 hypothetical protein I601_0718 [Nocardioides dokdonensis FR1436]